MAGIGITLDDVRAAIEALGTTPDNTNAGAIRAQVGTGSLATIQKHLVALRVQPAPVQAVVPPPPADTLAALWGAAVAAAGVDLGSRIERLTVERDRLAGDLALASADTDAALVLAESATEAAAKSEAERIATAADAHDLQMALTTRDQELQVARESIQSERVEMHRLGEQQLADLRHEQALQLTELRAALDRAGEREGRLHAESARLHEQVGRLSAELEACRLRNAQ